MRNAAALAVARVFLLAHHPREYGLGFGEHVFELLARRAFAREARADLACAVVGVDHPAQ
ncbi:hypothetical protein G4G28_12440 [Massilia sp. Dwa41.01b]|uniref:hypothetical protein n=1 Tax=Massilia sp. Dwa41.01b TaxID=2709302 RepID=UPI0016001F97|nr:hypothetical protein [Massilia sp. Dwa41.01b]QNA89080.1 hypothetical protein G4G28_12440 [Massilia sp. Dwa41.01b]